MTESFMHKILKYFVLLFPLSATAMTGEELLAHCTNDGGNEVEPICYGYIHGSLNSVPSLKICPKRTYYGYLNETVILYLKTNPKAWKKTASESVVKAVKKAYPCP
ncbi:MAG: hypothetical protein ACI89T_002570 [Cognaticolwellia sp.]|jgi:hypothetical protein